MNRCDNADEKGPSMALLKLVWAAVLTLVLAGVVSGLWAGLLTLNLQTTPALPWAAAIMAVVLWLAWLYANGRGWPRRTADARRALLRARGICSRTFALALFCGGLSLVALTGAWILAFQTGLMRGNSLPDFSQYPIQMVIVVIAMAALVGACVEEAAFRGYFQSLLERRYPAWIAIGVAALLLAPGHAATQGFALPTFVFYLLVDTMLGTTAFLCDSILPGIVVHTAGLATFFTLIWPNDAKRIVGTAAFDDSWFWIHVVQVVVFAILAVLAYRRLAATALRR
jgi:membrane protease YdiL (CAAX protease family)